MSKGGNTVPSLTNAEHIGPNDTGDNIEAKRAANYIWDENTEEWVRQTAVGGGTAAYSDSGGTDKKGLVDADRHVQTDVLSSALPSGAATESTLGTRLSELDFDTKTGSLTESAPGTDTASSGLNGRLQRIAQRLTSLIALLPGSLGQKARAASLAVTLSSEDISALTPPAAITGFATSAKQDTLIANTGASTPFINLSADVGVDTIKGSAGVLCSIEGVNTNTTDCIVVFYDIAGAVTVGVSAISYVFFIPKGDGTNYGAASIEFPNPLNFANAIKYATVTTAFADPTNDLVISGSYI